MPLAAREIAIDADRSARTVFSYFVEFVFKLVESRPLPQMPLHIRQIIDPVSNEIALIDRKLLMKPFVDKAIAGLSLETFERPNRLTHIISKKRFRRAFSVSRFRDGRKRTTRCSSRFYKPRVPAKDWGGTPCCWHTTAYRSLSTCQI